MTVITELLSSPRLQSSLRKIDTEETSFSLYQQLVPPGGLRLRGGEGEQGRKIGRRRSTGSPEWREWLVARESILLNEAERGEGENFYRNKRGDTGEIIYSEEESTAPSSLSSSTYSSSSCASDSEGEEGFQPGRFGLEDGEMRSFQLDEEDYPDTVRVGEEEEEEREEKEEREEGENEGEEKDFEGEGEATFYSSSPPPPPPSPTPFLLPASLRLSPILRNRRSSLPQI